MQPSRGSRSRTFSSHLTCTAMLHFLHDIPLPQTEDSQTAQVDGVTKEDDLNSCGRRSEEASSAITMREQATKKEKEA